MPSKSNLKTAVAAGALLLGFAACRHNENVINKIILSSPDRPRWIAPDVKQLPGDEQAKLIKYGRALVVNTSYYFGPKGVIAHKSNGLNCQNCHLSAGTKPFGNNFSLVAAGYPRFKERSGTTETIVKKVEDCFERSLDGQKIDSNSVEMKAFAAYLKWVGKNVKKRTKPIGSGIDEPFFLSRAADTVEGKRVYISKCQRCHGADGEGKLNSAGNAYVYPPVWGKHSYNIGASIYRLSKFAGYVKDNMPFGANYKKRQLTDAEAWDVAAFVNSRPRPFKNITGDWPKLATKPYDYPFGPYAEHLFSETQHKYGPFAPVKKYYEGLTKKK
ncbi:c-type cytochrome [Mucilaginibacter sp.]|jgi:thiosulfate dehydrogenase|uniref:c-type cytochrome n=1 Tax=Mucilaginibacter sp. TaxID=1882438 RepID=UPI002CBE04F2|nr:c-type cytochrome [Mucilaginibacter sp.]HTI60677.1 c-type cytochrome [Mucilaginibacter sp.]